MKKYTIEEVAKWVETYNKYLSFAEVDRVFELPRGTARYVFLVTYKKELGIKNKEETLEDLHKQGKGYCLYCFTIKDLSEFDFRTDTKKYRNECLVCDRKRHALWANEHPDVARKWKIKNPGKIGMWEKNHPDRVRELKRNYRTNHKEQINMRSRTYKKNHPEKVRFWDRKRREAKIIVAEHYTEIDEKITKTVFGDECFKCFSSTNLAIDHHYPLSKGHALTVENAVILCQSCNSSKGIKDPEQFYTQEELEKLTILFDKALKMKESLEGENRDVSISLDPER